VSDLKILNH